MDFRRVIALQVARPSTLASELLLVILGWRDGERGRPCHRVKASALGAAISSDDAAESSRKLLYVKHRMVGCGTGYRGSGAAGSDGSIILPRMGPAITSQSHPNESGAGENTRA